MNLPKWQGNGKEEGKAVLAAAPRKDLARGKFHGPKASRSRARPEQAQRPMESRRSARRRREAPLSRGGTSACLAAARGKREARFDRRA